MGQCQKNGRQKCNNSYLEALGAFRSRLRWTKSRWTRGKQTLRELESASIRVGVSEGRGGGEDDERFFAVQSRK